MGTQPLLEIAKPFMASAPVHSSLMCIVMGVEKTCQSLTITKVTATAGRRRSYLECHQFGNGLPTEMQNSVMRSRISDRRLQNVPVRTIPTLRPARSSRFHRFQHSAGSLVNSQTGNLKLAQKILGRSRFAKTANFYTHAIAEQDVRRRLPSSRQFSENLFSNGNNKAPQVIRWLTTQSWWENWTEPLK
jgi:hypothetical protein